MARWITDQVAVSGAAISSDTWHELVERLGVTVVVNLRSEYQDTFAPPLPVAYLWVPVEDHTDPTLEQLHLGARFIDAAVRAGHRVLVHCKMGIGRSPTMAAAYLIWTGLSVDEAMQQMEGDSRPRFGPVISRYTLTKFAASLDMLGRSGGFD
jgi:protein-tyrosine phosphatase